MIPVPVQGNWAPSPVSVCSHALTKGGGKTYHVCTWLEKSKVRCSWAQGPSSASPSRRPLITPDPFLVAKLEGWVERTDFLGEVFSDQAHLKMSTEEESG